MNLTNGLTMIYSKLKDKKSAGLMQDLFQFINLGFGELCERLKKPKDVADVVQDFINKKVNEFAKLWEFGFTNSREYYIEICEGFESLVMKSLYNPMMKLITKDESFDSIKQKYSFVSLSNLGLDCQIDEFELVTQIKSKQTIYLNFDK